MTEREKEICFRVRQIRKEIKWPQPAFAEKIGISRDRLANIEGGRTPLRFDLALTICRIFDVNIEWLAAGKLPARPYFHVFWSYEKNDEMKTRSLLTQAFEFLEGHLNAPADMVSKSEFEKDIPCDFDFRRQLVSFIKRICVITQFSEVKDSWRFFDDVNSFVETLLQKLRREGKATRIESIESELGPYFYRAMHFLPKNELTYMSSFGSIEDVDWQQLKKRIKKVTARPGEKTELAKKLGVDISQLSRWLKDSKTTPEPGADSTLTMLQWVMEREG